MNESIPVLSLKIRGRRYDSKISGDIAIKYDRTYRLCIKVQVRGENNEPKGTYIIQRISGEALFLHSITGSLDKMVAKLLLETTEPVCFENNELNHVRCNMITMEASVEQVGRIRELLMKLHGKELSRDTKSCEGIPQWTSMLPWWLYSKRLRTIIQQVLIFYTIFNTFWALWQLYRHVDVIRETIEPVLMSIHEACHAYLSLAMKIVNIAMEHFTSVWWRFFAPLKVLIGPLYSQIPLLISPLVKLLTSLYYAFGQLLFPMFSFILTASITTTWLLWYVICTLLRPISWLLWVIFSYILRPLLSITQYVPGLNKTTVDPVRVFVRALLLNSFKSVGNLLLWIARFARIYNYSENPKEKPLRKNRESRLERSYTAVF